MIFFISLNFSEGVIVDEVEYIDSKYDLEHQYKRNPLIIGFECDVVRSGENINQMQLLLIQMCQMHLPPLSHI